MGEVLAVDDNSADLDLLQEALREVGVEADLRFAACGGDAIAILERSPFVPHLVVVDLRLPRISGAEVVRFMTNHPRLREVPVLLLTGTDCERVRREYPFIPAGRCRTKPTDFDGYLRLAHEMRGLLGQVRPPEAG
jgi:CheY-like chemotaxis protein